MTNLFTLDMILPSFVTFSRLPRGDARQRRFVLRRYRTERPDATGSHPLRFLLLLLVASLLPAHAACAQWSQILGPGRDGSAAPGSLPVPVVGDRTLQAVWSLPLGAGYAGPAVADGLVLVAHRENDAEVLLAVDLVGGQVRWQADWPATYGGGIDPDNGPRCVPLVADERVLVYGAAGDLVCVRLADGKLLWHRRLREEYRADDGYFGAGSTPVLIDGLAIVNVGGRDGGIVAVEIETGKTRWTATDYDASYASPISIPSFGEPLALVVTRLHTVLLEARTGRELGEVRFGSRGPTVNAATPIPLGDNRYLLTASYGVGTTIVRIDGLEIAAELQGSDLLASQYNTPVRCGDRVVGIHGREDIGIASLRCIDPAAKRVVWEKSGFGTAHLLTDGQQVLAVGVDGTLTWIDATADAYRPLGTAQLPPGRYRALPAVVDGKLLVRGSQSPHASTLICVTSSER